MPDAFLKKCRKIRKISILSLYINKIKSRHSTGESAWRQSGTERPVLKKFRQKPQVTDVELTPEQVQRFRKKPGISGQIARRFSGGCS